MDGLPFLVNLDVSRGDAKPLNMTNIRRTGSSGHCHYNSSKLVCFIPSWSHRRMFYCLW